MDNRSHLPVEKQLLDEHCTGALAYAVDCFVLPAIHVVPLNGCTVCVYDADEVVRYVTHVAWPRAATANNPIEGVNGNHCHACQETMIRTD